MPELVPAEPGTPEWLAARRAGVTATDIVTILGLSHWDSVYSLFWRKMQQAPEVEDNDRFRLGRELEPIIIKRWQEEHQDLRPSGSGYMWRHSERTWQMATPDRHIFDHGIFTGVLEVKSWADADRHSWGGGYARYEGRIGDDGEHLDPEPVQPPAGNQIPATVRAQVLWQMDVMDVAVGHVGVVFLPSGEFRSYTIEHQRVGGCCRSAEYVAIASGPCDVCTDLELMRAAGEEFMARLRLELPPPDPDASAATLAAVRARFTRQPDKQAEVDRGTWNAWYGSKFEADRIDEQIRRYEIQLREQAGEAQIYTVDGLPVARRVIVDAQVKAHTRHQDYLRRIEPKGDDSV
jgi:YqaJ-like viral recombinase domain